MLILLCDFRIIVQFISLCEILRSFNIQYTKSTEVCLSKPRKAIQIEKNIPILYAIVLEHKALYAS